MIEKFLKDECRSQERYKPKDSCAQLVLTESHVSRSVELVFDLLVVAGIGVDKNAFFLKNSYFCTCQIIL